MWNRSLVETLTCILGRTYACMLSAKHQKFSRGLNDLCWAVLDVRNHSVASQRMVCSVPFLAFTRTCALCFWMVMTAHHVNTVPQFSPLPGCSCPVLRTSPQAARDKLLKALWYPSHRCFLCVCEQVLSCGSAVFPLHVNLKAEPGSQSPVLTFVAQVRRCVQHAQTVCRIWCSDFRPENKVPFEVFWGLGQSKHF